MMNINEINTPTELADYLKEYNDLDFCKVTIAEPGLDDKKQVLYYACRFKKMETIKLVLFKKRMYKRLTSLQMSANTATQGAFTIHINIIV